MFSSAAPSRCALSPIQEGLLFHAIDGPPAMYVSQVCCRFGAGFQTSAFEQAWSLMLARHSILRTAFVWEGADAPAQVIEPRVPLPLRSFDVAGLDAEAQNARIDAVLREDRERGFRPHEAPLMRLTRFDLGDARHEYAWTYHHLIMDAWSEAKLVSEIMSAYTALSAGRTPAFQPAPPYSAYVAWLDRQDLGAAEAYWRRTLAGLREGLCLGRPNSGGSGAETVELHWPRQLTIDLARVAREQRVTMATLLLGAWGLLLSSVCATDDVIFGQAVSGRPADLAGVEDIVGPFISTLPARIHIRRTAPLASWLHEVQRQQLEQRLFEHTPLVRIQEWSDVPRGTPLFDTLFVFQNSTLRSAQTPPPSSLAPVRVRDADGPTHYALSADIRPGPPLTIVLTCDRARIDDVTLASLGPALRAILAALASTMTSPVADVLAAADSERLRARDEATRAIAIRARQSLARAVRRTVAPNAIQEIAP